MKKLKKRRRKLERRVNRNQKLLRKARQLVHRLRKAGRKGMANAVENKVSVPLRKRIQNFHDQIKEIDLKITALQDRGDDGRRSFVKWLESTVGKAEGGKLHRKIVSEMHGVSSWPWCSAYTAYGLVKHGGFKESELPTNPWYSGNWLTWRHGRRVTYSQAQPGDLLIFDWGDGGITDHVAIYIGHGLKIGGNENDRVERDAVPVSNIVGVIRPDWDHNER